MSKSVNLPPLPLEEWEETKKTLHLFLQIIGKIRLKLMPRKNHWWYITGYVSTKGITTGAIPYEDGTNTFEITLDFTRHILELSTSKGETKSFPLDDGLTVASFHKQLFDILDGLNIYAKISDKPYDMFTDKPFAEIAEGRYQKEYIERFWKILIWVDSVFKEFSGRFYGKTCPVHIYWHHMDLTVTRFSGRKAPPMPAGSRISDKDAYTHEVISFGFWAGDENVRGAAFYSYTYPSPAGLDKETLSPAYSNWIDNNGSPMAMMMYDDLRKSDNPREDLLDFMESAYQAGAKLAKWDIEDFKVPGLKDL